MFNKILDKKSSSAAPSPEKTNAGPSSASADHYIEKCCKNRPGLEGFLEHLKSRANPNVHRPLKWSLSEGGLSTFWAKSFNSPLNSRMENSDLATRVQWCVDLVKAATAFNLTTVSYLQNVSLVVNEQGDCEIDILNCLYPELWDLKKPVFFGPEDIFWAIAWGLPKNEKLDFLLPFWLGSQVYQILTRSSKPYEPQNGSIVDGIRCFMSADSEFSKKLQFQDSHELSESVASVLRKMLSFDRNKRYCNAAEALSALAQALE